MIVTSPLQRARRTAETVAEATGAPVTVDDGLVETDFGEWEGLTFARGHGAVAGGDFRLAGQRRGGAARRREPGHGRAAGPRARWTGCSRRSGPGTLLLVSHVTPIKTLACRAMLAPPATMFRMHLDVGSLCEIQWFADGPALVRSLNDTAHLRAGAR